MVVFHQSIQPLLSQNAFGKILMNYLLGIDVSTTATKALLIDEQGRVAGVGVSEYSFDTPKPLWSEQHPELWWQGTIHSIRQALAQSGVPLSVSTCATARRTLPAPCWKGSPSA